MLEVVKGWCPSNISSTGYGNFQGRIYKKKRESSGLQDQRHTARRLHIHLQFPTLQWAWVEGHLG